MTFPKKLLIPKTVNTMPPLYSLLVLGLLPASLFAQTPALQQKTAYTDVLFLNNLYRDSENPTALSRNTLDVSDLRFTYNHEKGAFRAVNAAGKENDLNLSLYGTRRFRKTAFEGNFNYTHAQQNEKRWGSTLFSDANNPFFLADSIASDFTTETFRLNGGVSYCVAPQVHIAVRADYHAGSSANQTDPRPTISATRFHLNPGIDYAFSNFTLGFSGCIGWMHEDCKYSVVRTYENHRVFLFSGLTEPGTATAVGYKRRYTGTDLNGALQFAWQDHTTGNFFEISYRKGEEDAEDDRIAYTYQGGKYRTNGLHLTDRFLLKRKRANHNIILEARLNQSESVGYQQETHTDANGNTTNYILDESICQKGNIHSLSAGYRLDLVNHDRFPVTTAGIKGGMYGREDTHYPDKEQQKYTLIYGEVYATRRFCIGKLLLTATVDLTYTQGSDFTNTVYETTLTDRYHTPLFEYRAANRFDLHARLSAQHPVTVKKFTSYIGGFIDYGYSCYTGDFAAYRSTDRYLVHTGLSMTF